ncbi:hypothetical protein L3X38_004408 [Prunus dulcis]|uniref:Chromo domain-containing protein n=1 Tax=Prunus dulcis TaxID=3755 RepID=A0AAD4ZNS7_PRUDU|nr:hypothetical protein L3X38_004408 [Prunus dulcis]
MVFRGCYVQVGDAVLEADLIPLDLIDLDIILGMDWLEKHHASAGYFRKEIILKSPGQLEVVFCGERRVLQSCLISAIRAKRLLKFCVGYLAHLIDDILDRKEQRLRSRSILVVEVLWRNQTVEEVTWEPEALMRTEYPYLFN